MTNIAYMHTTLISPLVSFLFVFVPVLSLSLSLSRSLSLSFSLYLYLSLCVCRHSGCVRGLSELSPQNSAVRPHQHRPHHPECGPRRLSGDAHDRGHGKCFILCVCACVRVGLCICVRVCVDEVGVPCSWHVEDRR